MIQNVTKLEVKVGEKIYQFLCDQDSPITGVKEALIQFMSYSVNIERQAQERAQLPPLPKSDLPVEDKVEITQG